MKKNYEVELTEQDLKQIIEKYFEEKENIHIKFESKTTREYTGFHEQEIAMTKYYCESEIQIMGINKKAKFELSEEDIKSILREVFDKYELQSIKFQSKIEVQDYTLPNRAIFNGIKITLKEKEQKQTRGFNSILDISDTPQERPQSMYDPRNTGGYYEDWGLRR